MRGLKESLLSGVAGIVGLLLALLASAMWGGVIGLIWFAFQSPRPGNALTADGVALGFAIFAAIVTFIFETPLVRWLYRFMDGLQEAVGLMALIFILPVHLPLLIGRICLSWIPVKILCLVLGHIEEKSAAVCHYAGSIIASREINLDGVIVQPGNEVMRIRKDWKMYREDTCFGWVDRSGRFYRDSTIQHKIVDPDLQINSHPTGIIDGIKVYLANQLVGTIVPE